MSYRYVKRESTVAVIVTDEMGVCLSQASLSQPLQARTRARLFGTCLCVSILGILLSLSSLPWVSPAHDQKRT